MKLISYYNGNQIRAGVIQDNTVIDIGDEFSDVLSVIKAGNLGLERINKILHSDVDRREIKRERLVSPIPKLERNILCVGWNYLEHFNEREQQDIDLPSKPTIFTKATGTIAGPYERIPLPNNYTNKFDYEAELAVVIGWKGKKITEEEAFDYIFGFMCANDLSARDVQQAHGGQWFMGKSIDKSCPTGPWLVTKDEIADVQNLDIICKVNGNMVQSSNTNLMMFSIKQIISEISQAMTLMPGDIILTGTPPGIGAKRNPPILLKSGDVVEVEIDGIGSIKNHIISDMP
ncbi:2-hydroxyhepta-2,4-diene-1,7-dioate isomerase [Lentibacillus populi]|uniref:2-hydroxyhepta-2,4-diene-1,7-dioate isomerase n=1 Tax=Lentibacillus populi TaxID=1827502 RepID=A0A9W5U0F4_9BACI|nr:fumarylacetoacetate hydrolase family protein [Lentibacillus populi]GGB53306.1 2-hydroxyhepta-2,4-diene-1,7-dioate isomerase [Lentibacillus populi]